MSSGLKKSLLWIVIVLSFNTHVYPATKNVIPGYSTEKINKIISESSAGDTILFGPGTYTGPFILKNVNGSVNLPIVMSAMGSSAGTATIDGKSEPGMGKKNNAFSLEDCSWIVIEGFTIRNCWTDIITATNVSWFSLKSCNVSGGKRVVFAKDRGSHHFLVEDCKWEQDERVWTHEEGYSWEEVHHGIHQHYNGSLFQGSRISGVFVLRDNNIKNTFNAFRLSQIDDNETDLLACSNGEVYGNYIRNTSDNVFEPELHCHNLHFYHNQLINGHAFISVTGVGGGPIYLYGNTGLSEPDCEDGWTIFKLSNEERTLTEPFYIFNNSWHVDYPFAGRLNKWRNTNTTHFNNAYILEKLDTVDLQEAGESNSFDYDCFSIPISSHLLTGGNELKGIEVDPRFRDPLKGDFRLQEDSPCTDMGKSAKELILSYEGDAPDIGAWEGEQLVVGPAFRFSDPPEAVQFKEHCRVTKYMISGNNLTLWLSIPVRPVEMDKVQFALISSGMLIPLKAAEAIDDGYCYVFSAEQDLKSFEKPELILSSWPTGINGMIMTDWASVLPIIQSNSNPKP